MDYVLLSLSFVVFTFLSARREVFCNGVLLIAGEEEDYVWSAWLTPRFHFVTKPADRIIVRFHVFGICLQLTHAGENAVRLGRDFRASQAPVEKALLKP